VDQQFHHRRHCCCCCYGSLQVQSMSERAEQHNTKIDTNLYHDEDNFRIFNFAYRGFCSSPPPPPNSSSLCNYPLDFSHCRKMHIRKVKVTLKNSVFWDVMPCDDCKNRRFGGTYCHTVFIRSQRLLLVTANVVPSPPILVTVMMEAICASETSITRATRSNIPEERILHSHRRENLKS
jgi:hypothetical protein